MSRKTTPPPQAEAPVERAPAFQPFTWIDPSTVKTLPADRVLDALGQIRDLTSGTRVLVQMLEQDELAKGSDGVCPLMDANSRGDLLRLAITASRLAAEAAADVIDWAGDHSA